MDQTKAPLVSTMTTGSPLYVFDVLISLPNSNTWLSAKVTKL
jgi:hypothetical protein